MREFSLNARAESIDRAWSAKRAVMSVRFRHHALFFYKEFNMITFIMQVVNVVLAIFMVFAMATASRDERLIPIIMIIIHMLNFCVIGGILK